MVKAYINYPNPHVMLHTDALCASIGQQHKEGQRIVRLDISSLSTELYRFKTKHYRFGSDTKTNDMWLELDFGDSDLERAIVKYIKKLLSQYYTPFASVNIDQHC